MMQASKPDPFAAFYHTARQARAWRRWAVALGALVALQTAVVAVVALRPPLVVIKDRDGGAAPVVVRMVSDPPTTLADARLFFGQMAQLRFGWDSASVARDLEAFLRQCHPSHRETQLRHLKGAPEQAPGAAPAGGRGGSGAGNGRVPFVTRLQAWQDAHVANILTLPPTQDDVFCRRRADDPIWDCAVQAQLLVRSLDGLQGATAAAQQGVTLLATLAEVPHTQQTPYGLLVGYLDMLPATGRDLTAGAP